MQGHRFLSRVATKESQLSEDYLFSLYIRAPDALDAINLNSDAKLLVTIPS